MINFPSGEIDLDRFKVSYRDELLGYIDSCAKPRVVYWEESLMARAGLIVKHSALTDHDVSNSIVLNGDANSFSPPGCKSIIFILTSKVHVVDWAQKFLLRDSRPGISKQYYIIAIPTLSYACKTFLKENGVLDRFTSIYNFPLTILPIDSDVLSLEDTNCFADYAIAHAQHKLYQFAQGLMRFQSIFGLFPKVRARGDKALEVLRILDCMHKNVSPGNQLLDDDEDLPQSTKRCSSLAEIDSQTDMLVIIDRLVDPLTPLLSQLTYEGLISTRWGIRYGVCYRDDVEEEKKKPFSLKSSDEVFSQLRDVNFDSFWQLINQRAKEAERISAESKSAKRLSDLRRVVSQLPQNIALKAALARHISIAESLQSFVNADRFMLSFNTQQDLLNGNETDKAHPYVEQCILQGAALNEVLRLICIQSFCNGGLKRHLLEYYKREILQVYGFEHMFTLENLDRVGLLYGSPNDHQHTQRTSDQQASLAVRQVVTGISQLFSSGSLKRSFRLLVPSVSTGNTTAVQSEVLDVDTLVGRIYAGYIPISVRLVQSLAIDRPLVRPVTTILSGHVAMTIGRASSLSRLQAPTSAMKRLVTGILNRDEPNAARPADWEAALRSSPISVLPVPERDKVQRPEAVNPTDDGLEEHKRPRVIVVAFVGGVTHAELSALRTLASASDANIQFVFITTGFLTADSYLSSLSQCIEPADLLAS